MTRKNQSDVATSVRQLPAGKHPDVKHDRKLIFEAIQNEEARLVQLDEERRGITERLQQLRAQLVAYEAELSSATESPCLTQADWLL